VFEETNEDVLHDVFGFGAIAQDGVRDAKEQSGVGVDEIGEVDL